MVRYKRTKDPSTYGTQTYLADVREDERLGGLGVALDGDDLVVAHHVPELSVDLQVAQVHRLLAHEREVVVRDVERSLDAHLLIFFYCSIMEKDEKNHGKGELRLRNNSNGKGA